MTTRKQKRWRKWASDQATRIVRQDEQRCLNLALERFRRHLRQLERQYGNLADVPRESLVSTGKGQRTIRSKALKANVVWTPTADGPKLNRLAGGKQHRLKLVPDEQRNDVKPIDHFEFIIIDRMMYTKGISKEVGIQEGLDENGWVWVSFRPKEKTFREARFIDGFYGSGEHAPATGNELDLVKRKRKPFKGWAKPLDS